MADWHDEKSVREGWADAPAPGEDMQNLLDAAKVQCGVFAGLFTQAEADAAEMEDVLGWLHPKIPARIREAHALQVRALWTRKTNGPSDSTGFEGYTLQEYDMSARIRRLLRPQSGKARVG